MSDRSDSHAIVAVNRATERDLAAVHELMAEWEREDITIGQEACEEAYLRGYLAEFFFVARESRRIVGFICARIVASPDYAVMPNAQRVVHIEELYVRRQARCRGVGTALVEAVLQKAREQGVRAFHVFSATRDTDAIVGFYRRHGFEPWGVQMYLVQTDESRTEPTGG